jgi:5'(3')-deoxyribonucleotidase/uncharacterized protein with PQ loop repeat
MPLPWSAVAGTTAAVCTTLAFLPQFVSLGRRGNKELSPLMLALYLAGQGLWLAYGLLIGSGPIVGANAVSFALVSAVIWRRLAGGGSRRLRIAIDMDEVMADAFGEHLRRYNAAFGANLRAADVHGRHLEDVVPADQRTAVEAMYDASFFAALEVMDGCQEVVGDLASRHDVLIVTAAMDVPCSFDAKFRWLQQHFPFIPASSIVFCGDKGVVDADYLIDDRPRHFPRFKGKPLLFSAPHNARESRYPRVSSWQEVGEFFARVEGRTAPVRQRSSQTRRLDATATN